MKLLLTAGGVTNPSIRDALVDLLGKPIAESSALCIPTAMYGHPMAGPGVKVWQFISGRSENPMVDLGWKSVGVLELTALPSIDRDRWVPMVQEADVLLVAGGDALYLCHWMRQSGLTDLLPSLPPATTPHWGSSTSRSAHTWPPTACRVTPWPSRNGGRPGLVSPHTRWTTRPPSRWSMAPSRSSPRGTGSCSRPRDRDVGSARR